MAYVDKVNVNGTNYDLGKPLYYHPITIFRRNQPDGANMTLTFSIINNSPTPLNTMSAILAEIRSWGLNVASINCNGQVTNPESNNRQFNVGWWSVGSTTSLTGMYIDTGEVTGIWGIDDYISGASIEDQVNKIN